MFDKIKAALGLKSDTEVPTAEHLRAAEAALTELETKATTAETARVTVESALKAEQSAHVATTAKLTEATGKVTTLEGQVATLEGFKKAAGENDGKKADELNHDGSTATKAGWELEDEQRIASLKAEHGQK